MCELFCDIKRIQIVQHSDTLNEQLLYDTILWYSRVTLVHKILLECTYNQEGVQNH